MEYLKAIFTEVKDIYTSAVVECRFYCDHSLVDSEDHVIVVKVGGDQKLADKELKNFPEVKDFGERMVAFTKKYFLLPLDQLEDDFFQFQYLKGEEVFGASKPFRITEEEDIWHQRLEEVKRRAKEAEQMVKKAKLLNAKRRDIEGKVTGKVACLIESSW